MQYAGMAMQFFVSIGMSVWLGRYADKSLNRSEKPLFTWILPVVVIIGIITKIFIDTGKTGKKK